MALKGIKVIEIVGLAPAPFCGLVLSDFGAKVVRVDKPFAAQPDCLTRGKKSVLIDLKKSEGKQILMKLCETADVLIEPFRAGVMERLQLGPQVLIRSNEKLIYARLSGYGQTGALANKAGHDINYLAISGILCRLGEQNMVKPAINLLGDFAGGGLMCALGICLALIERSRSGKGQVIDANIVEGVNYVSSWIWNSMNSNYALSSLIWPNADKVGANTLDGGAPFYRCYRTKDDKFMAVGAIEPSFWKHFVSVIQLDESLYDRFDVNKWNQTTQQIEQIFLTKTQAEWTELFDKVDACVTPVVDIHEAQHHDHNKSRQSFFNDGTPKPSPVLSRTPANPLSNEQPIELHTKEVLLQIGYSMEDICKLENQRIIQLLNESKL